MNLSQALEVKSGDIVVFVGAGGKTHAMFRLATELSEQGARVITTTTTRIAQDELGLAPQAVRPKRGTSLSEWLPSQLEQHRHVFLFTRLERNHKVRGLRANWLDENLAQNLSFDALLVEADGSRRLPMKAPFSHEPPIPASATVVVPVVGLDALGQPLDSDHIYGAYCIQRTIGYKLGKPVTPELVAATLLHPKLGLKNIPPDARIVPLLNKATLENLPTARQIAAYLLSDLNVERVMIGAVMEADPVLEVHRRVGAVILAAGQSQRMGRPKLLLPWGKSSTIIRQVCQQVLACRPYETIVVTGELKDAIQAQIADLPVRVIHNPFAAEGEMLSSLQVGLQTIWRTSDACLVVLGDQPTIEQDVITQVLLAYARGYGQIVVPIYRKRRGHPLIIDRSFWQAIMELPQGAAPRDMLRANQHALYELPVNTPSVLDDIDTPEDYNRIRRRKRSLSAPK
jgi:molybdenum cofactor cytidylyltransferase